MSTVTDPEIQATFQAARDGFTSRNAGGFVSCPPCVIASAANRALGALDLPPGYDSGTLDRIIAITGHVGVDVRVSVRQAGELAQIGAQLLALDGDGHLSPRLGYLQRQSIAHLVTLATR